MALVRNYKIGDDYEIENAYHVIDSVSLVKTIKKISEVSQETDSEYIASIFIHVFPSKDLRNNGSKPIAFINGAMHEYEDILKFKFNYNISDTENLVSQAYNHLKTTEYYKDAVED